MTAAAADNENFATMPLISTSLALTMQHLGQHDLGAA